MPIWLQIHKLSDDYCRKNFIEKLLKNARKGLEVRINGNLWGDHVRVRVKHDVCKTLTTFFSIFMGKAYHIYAGKYEKLA